MPNIKPLKREALPQFKTLFDHYEQTRGFVPHSILTMARRPNIAQAFMDLNRAVLYEGSVSEELKMLLSLLVSNMTGCLYCQAHMANLSNIYKASKEKIESLYDYRKSELFPQAERAALDLAYHVVLEPNADHNKWFSQLKNHFDDAEIVEIVATISLFAYLNRWNDTMETSLEEHAENQAKTLLAKQNWQKGKHK